MIAEILIGTGKTPEKALDALSIKLTRLQDMRYEISQISEPTLTHNSQASSAQEVWTAGVSIQRGESPRVPPRP